MESVWEQNDSTQITIVYGSMNTILAGKSISSRLHKAILSEVKAVKLEILKVMVDDALRMGFFLLRNILGKNYALFMNKD